jgi:hypothetical protein
LYVSRDAYTFLIKLIQTRILHVQRSGHYERVPGRLYDVHAAKDCRPQAQRDQEPWQGGAGPSSHKTGNFTHATSRDFCILHSWNSYALEIIDSNWVQTFLKILRTTCFYVDTIFVGHVLKV